MTKKHREERTLRASAEQVWLAGLGALALAEKEGGRLFTALVERGSEYRDVSRERIEDAVDRVRGEVRAYTDGPLNRIEARVGDGTESVLHRLNVPSRREISSLTRRVEELTKALERKPARRRAARKPRPAAAHEPVGT